MKLMKPITTTRFEKGSSLIRDIKDFTAIDIETTGFDPCLDEIVEVGAIKYRSSKPVDTFVSLIKISAPLDPFLVELSGITDDMLQDAPDLSEVLGGFLQFIGNDIVVGHCVSFDVNFLYDNSIREGYGPFKNDFIDTLRISRRLYRDWSDHKLDTLVSNLGLVPRDYHRAENDARLAAEAYLSMCEENDLSQIPEKPRRSSTRNISVKDIVAESGHEDVNSPLYHAVCVFTGALEKMLRKDAMQLVVNIGGECAASVTKKTNFLIVGNNDYKASVKEGKSVKLRRAEDLIRKGADLQIISESVFYDMVLDD